MITDHIERIGHRFESLWPHRWYFIVPLLVGLLLLLVILLLLVMNPSAGEMRLF